ncbi:MAG: hypothetical protein AAFN78_05905 [Pseudomonadota bacterium]
MSTPPAPENAASERWFQVFKYTVYTLLVINIALFFREEWLASRHVFAGGVEASRVIEAFAATIDTAMWVVLLLLFELETSVLPDERITGRVKLWLHGTRLVCYSMVVYACYGYVVKAFSQYLYAPADIASLCDLVGSNAVMLIDLDKFRDITGDNCASDVASSFVTLPGTAVYAASEVWRATVRLAWTDVINAASWIAVVIVLEVDVRLQLVGKLDGAVMVVSKALKAVLYTTLVACAVYWGVAGDFLDFWDAFLWILAFVAIELNVFHWQAESRQAAPAGAPA